MENYIKSVTSPKGNRWVFTKHFSGLKRYFPTKRRAIEWSKMAGINGTIVKIN